MEDIRFQFLSKLEGKDLPILNAIAIGNSIEFSHKDTPSLGFVEKIDGNRLSGKLWFRVHDSSEVYQTSTQFEIDADKVARKISVRHLSEIGDDSSFFFSRHLTSSGTLLPVKGYTAARRFRYLEYLHRSLQLQWIHNRTFGQFSKAAQQHLKKCSAGAKNSFEITSPCMWETFVHLANVSGGKILKKGSCYHIIFATPKDLDPLFGLHWWKFSKEFSNEIVGPVTLIMKLGQEDRIRVRFAGVRQRNAGGLVILDSSKAGKTEPIILTAGQQELDNCCLNSLTSSTLF